ncbi:MAG: hypothetical protein CR975_05630 [Gammaproteobacteria bacterium]|nr:MAG: hypothetical protein CR975_05630 [Gammaproteobacteria bacterium]
MKLKQQLSEFMAASGMNQTQIATQIGKSPAVVSQYLKGHYRGDNSKLERQLKQLMERYQQKRKNIKLGFVETQTARRIMRLVSMAHEDCEIQLVIGEAGLGKTVTLKEYANDHADVIFIEVEPTFNAKVLLATLCDKLGLGPSRTNHEMFEAVRAKLNNSGRLLIIDEAELLQHKPLEILRRLHDLAGIGVVLAGMPRLRANLRGKRGEFKQLYSRVAFALDLGQRLSDDDLGLMAASALGTDDHNACLIDACDGNARRLAKLVRGIKRYADDSGEPISDKMIEQFSEMLIR